MRHVSDMSRTCPGHVVHAVQHVHLRDMSRTCRGRVPDSTSTPSGRTRPHCPLCVAPRAQAPQRKGGREAGGASDRHAHHATRRGDDGPKRHKPVERALGSARLVATSSRAKWSGCRARSTQRGLVVGAMAVAGTAEGVRERAATGEAGSVGAETGEVGVAATGLVVAAMAVAGLVVAVMVRGGPLLLRVRVVRVGLAQPGVRDARLLGAF